jgi:hypothetical protein
VASLVVLLLLGTLRPAAPATGDSPNREATATRPDPESGGGHKFIAWPLNGLGLLDFFHFFGKPEKMKPKPPTGIPCQVVATWKSAVEYFPDRLNNGRPTPKLEGRVYLLDNRLGQPIVADGELVVSVYDELPPLAPNGDPLPLQIWTITPDRMKPIQSRDPFGWGYTLNLPWDTYRPEIRQIRFTVQYCPPKKAKDQMPLDMDSGSVKLECKAQKDDESKKDR